MKNVLALYLTLLLFSLSACSLPGGAPETDLPATAAPTLAATSTPVEPTPPVRETPISLDPCLLGIWTMDTYALNNKFLDLTHSPTMYVLAPSAMTIEFRDNNVFILNGQVSLHSDLGSTGNYMELGGYHEGEGSYAADGELLTFVTVNYVVEYGEMRVYINGELVEAPFSPTPVPAIRMSPPEYADYRCSGNLLEITYAGPQATVIEEWRK